jgi:hypothetical protein
MPPCPAACMRLPSLSFPSGQGSRSALSSLLLHAVAASRPVAGDSPIGRPRMRRLRRDRLQRHADSACRTPGMAIAGCADPAAVPAAQYLQRGRSARHLGCELSAYSRGDEKLQFDFGLTLHCICRRAWKRRIKGPVRPSRGVMTPLRRPPVLQAACSGQRRQNTVLGGAPS